jgi:hypothetical protein
VTAHPFLSDEWVSAARQLRAELREEHGGAGADPSGADEVRVNVHVTKVPFGDGTVEGHLDTSAGDLEIDLGHLDDPHVTVTLDYDTARALVVDGDQQAVMAAFMGGRLVVEGDLARLLAVAARPPSPDAAEATARIRAITA